MMRSLCLALALSSAAAFTPPVARASAVQSRAAAPPNAVEGLVGDISPLGYFDPLGMSKGKTLEQMTSYREAELKHGRAAMAACLGWIVQPFFHPLAKDCHVSHPEDPIKTLYDMQPAGLFQIFVFIGFLEFVGIKIKQDPDNLYVAGDLLGASELVDSKDPKWVNYQRKELSNGRLAMVAIMGFWIQDLLFGQVGDMLFKPMLG